MSFEFTKGYGQFSSGSSSSSSYSTSYSESDSMELPEQQHDHHETQAPVRKEVSDKPRLQKELPANARRGKATKTKAAAPTDTGRSLRNPPPEQPKPKPQKRGPPSGSVSNESEKRVGIAENLDPDPWSGGRNRRQDKTFTTESGHRVQMQGRRGSLNDMPTNMHASPQDVARMRNAIFGERGGVERVGVCVIF